MKAVESKKWHHQQKYSSKQLMNAHDSGNIWDRQMPNVPIVNVVGDNPGGDRKDN